MLLCIMYHIFVLSDQLQSREVMIYSSGCITTKSKAEKLLVYRKYITGRICSVCVYIHIFPITLNWAAYVITGL